MLRLISPSNIALWFDPRELLAFWRLIDARLDELARLALEPFIKKETII